MHPRRDRGRNDRVPGDERQNQPQKCDPKARKRARGKFARLVSLMVNSPYLIVIIRQKNWIIDRYANNDYCIQFEELQDRGLATVWPLILAA